MITRRDVFAHLPVDFARPERSRLPRAVGSCRRAQKDGRVLVVIQLDGGNDGINTVVPFKDEGYARNRRSSGTAGETADLCHRGDRPSSRDARCWPDARGRAPRHRARCRLPKSRPLPLPKHGHLAYGPARPGRSLWARLDRRGLDARAVPGASGPASLYIGAGKLPVGPTRHIRVRRRARTHRRPHPRPTQCGEARGRRHDGQPRIVGQCGVVRSVARRSTPTQRPIAWQPWAATTPTLVILHRAGPTARPDRPAAQRGLGARVFYTLQTGYDTHRAQPGTHFQLLNELSGALEAFHADLGASGLLDRVLVMAFSEFGRRVAENGSAGTDHGTSGPVFLAGTHIQSGLIGSYPSLTDLVDGDLKMTVDFRRVYATVLEDWLGLASEKALNGTFRNECRSSGRPNRKKARNRGAL